MNLSIQNFLKKDRLIPLNQLSDNDRNLVLKQSKLIEVEPRTLLSQESDCMTYLLEGQVTLLSSGFISEKFIHTDSRALRPIFNENLEQDSVLFSSHGVILEVDRAFFEGLYLQSQAASIEQSETDLSQSEEEIFQHLYQAFQSKKLALPILPEAALKIRRAVNSSNVSSQFIIDIVQTDAVLSARLLKVANSPLYGTWREIKTIKDAVRRLGVEATRNLSFSLSVNQLYLAKTSLIKKEMKALSAQTRRISSLAFLLAQEFSYHLDPEQAVLAGLLQGVGFLPILKYIDDHPSLAQNKAQLNKSMEKLVLPISILLFNKWHFDPSFIQHIECAEDWFRKGSEQIDYTDILIAARLLYLYEEGKQLDQLPDLNTLPVMLKLGIFNDYISIDAYLNQTKQQVLSMDGLLS